MSRKANKVTEMQLAARLDKMFSTTKVYARAEAQPLVSSNGHSIVVSQTEFVTDVGGSSAFYSTIIPINAGLPVSFPQLAQLASLFELYTFTELSYEYRPTIQDQIANSDTAMGTVGLIVQYNPTDKLPTSKLQANQFEGAVTAKPSDSMILHVDVAKKKRDNILAQYYTRVGDIVHDTFYGGGISDLRMSDYGNLIVYAQGQQFTGLIGELYVHYKCHLYKMIPVQPTIAGNPLQARYYQNIYQAYSTDIFGAINPVEPIRAYPGSNVLVQWPTPNSGLAGNQFVIETALPIGSKWQMEFYWEVPHADAGSWSTVIAIALDSGLSADSTATPFFGNSSTAPAPPLGGARSSRFQLISSSDSQMAAFTFQVTGAPSYQTGFLNTVTGWSPPGGNAAKFDFCLFQLLDSYVVASDVPIT